MKKTLFKILQIDKILSLVKTIFPAFFSLAIIFYIYKTIILLEPDIELGNLPSKSDTIFLCLVLLIYQLGIYLISIRFKLIANIETLSRLRSFFINLAAHTIAQILPGPTADLFRMYILKEQFGINFKNLLNYGVIDRLFSLIAALIIGIISIPFVFHFYTNSTSETLLAFWIFTAVTFLIGVKFWVKYFPLPYINRPVICFLLSIGYILILAFIFTGISFNLNIEILTAILFFPVILVVSSLPVFYAGWGGRELAIIYIFNHLLDYSVEKCLNLSISFGLVMYLANMPGVLFLVIESRSMIRNRKR